MGWALINFFCLQDGRLFEVGTNSRLGAYSNKYGMLFVTDVRINCLFYLLQVLYFWYRIWSINSPHQGCGQSWKGYGRICYQSGGSSAG